MGLGDGDSTDFCVTREESHVALYSLYRAGFAGGHIGCSHFVDNKASFTIQIRGTEV